MNRAAVALPFAALGALGVLVGCAGEERARSACSTGTPYSPDADFPPGAQPGAGPTCVLRCGDTSMASWGAGGALRPTISALPTGACEHDGEACNLDAVKPCPSQGPDRGTLMLFECRCQRGAWSCTGAYQAGGACTSARDAGSEG